MLSCLCQPWARALSASASISAKDSTSPAASKPMLRRLAMRISAPRNMNMGAKNRPLRV